MRLGFAGAMRTGNSIRPAPAAPLRRWRFLLLVYVLTDWNVATTFLTVTRRFTEIQRQLALNHAIWFFIGLPLFLLFVSPSLVLFGATALRRRRPLTFGARLSIVTIIALFIFGYVKGRFTGAKPIKSAFQTALIGSVAAAAAFFIARLIGG